MSKSSKAHISLEQLLEYAGQKVLGHSQPEMEAFLAENDALNRIVEGKMVFLRAEMQGENTDLEIKRSQALKRIQQEIYIRKRKERRLSSYLVAAAFAFVFVSTGLFSSRNLSIEQHLSSRNDAMHAPKQLHKLPLYSHEDIQEEEEIGYLSEAKPGWLDIIDLNK